MIIEDNLRQRLEGIKNEAGVYVTPAFPKLIYVLDEHNCLKGGEYDYITELAIKCSAKRMYPDYISAKKMRENYEGNVFSCMGCRSFLSPWKDENGEYKWEGRFNQGVVSLNLPQIAILAKGDDDKFWSLLDERVLQLCYDGTTCRHRALEGVTSDVSPSTGSTVPSPDLRRARSSIHCSTTVTQPYHWDTSVYMRPPSSCVV